MLIRLMGAALAAMLLAGGAFAQDGGGEAEAAKRQAFLDSLHFQSGSVALPSADSHINVSPGFRFLANADARRVLEDYWGNPPDDSVLGMLVPDAAGLDSDHSWAVIITYSDEGYVSDEDAQKIDYADLLKQMQKETHEANDERKQQHYPTMELVGWAQPPRYDNTAKRLHWAKELQVEGYESNTLNYDIRVLGREGFLSLNAVADVKDLNRVNEGMQQVLSMAQFDAGHTYADYKPGHDKLAAFGLAALVGGGIAAKTGLLAKLGVFLLAAKKFVVLALAGLVALFKRWFGKKDNNKTVS